MLSVALGVIAFSAPAPRSNLPSKLPALRDSKLLALRGGGVDPITTLAALNVASGLGSWIAPKESLAMYGVKREVTAYELFWMRAIAGVQFASAAALMVGKTDIDKATIVWLYSHALATLANIPMIEAMGAPKSAVVACIGIFVLISALAQKGVISGMATIYAVAAFYVLTSVIEVFSPSTTTTAFGFTETSGLVEGLTATFGANKLATVLFLVVSKLTGKSGVGLVASCATIFFLCIKNSLAAETMGIEKSGLAFWAVAQAVLAYFGYAGA
jgi:hypothetical protein